MNNPMKKSQAPSIATLTARLMHKLSTEDVATPVTSEVELHEAAGGLRTETLTTWNDTLNPYRLQMDGTPHMAPPREWAAWQNSTGHRSIVTMAVGHFPQMLANTTALLADEPQQWLEHDASCKARSFDMIPSLDRADLPPLLQQLLMATRARLAGDHAGALQMLDEVEDGYELAEHAVIRNERAACLWEQGAHDAACLEWEALPEGPVKSFNLGLAALVMGQPAPACEHLARAIEQLPETSGWKYLAAMYAEVAAHQRS